MNANLYIYYRISDKGRPKDKLPYADKIACLLNAIREFGKKNFYIIADNCSPETITIIRSEGIMFEETSLGNSASFIYMMDKIIHDRMPDDAIYLIEDDYIHRRGGGIVLEGLSIADYVTLYDHPDKYWLESAQGNPFNHKQIQKTRLYITNSTYWRETNSSTMTFACRMRTLREDYQIWKKFCSIDKTPKDFHAFMAITQNSFSDMVSFFLQGKRRRGEFKILLKNILTRRKVKRLVSSIPAYATHTDTAFIAPFINWETEI
ncbi:hypothetical protein FACS189476_04030 [Spirochaetia bacterium]|nr:hypothetical protein FACS189476_04030 [Spirochaetia bacterium]